MLPGLAPEFSLHHPIDVTEKWPERSLCDRLEAVDALQEENLLLDVWREERQIEDLRNTRRREAQRACAVGAVCVVPARDVHLEPVGQREELGDARWSLART